MSHRDDPSLTSALAPRRDALVAAWYQALASTGFLAQRATLVRQQLQALGDQVLALLARADADPQQADQLGVQLAQLGYLNADALGRTQTVLLQTLTTELTSTQLAILLPRLATLLGGLARGYTTHLRHTIVSEQAQIQQALSAAYQQQQQARQQRDEVFYTVITTLPIIVVRLDRDGVVRRALGPGLTRLGVTPAALVGQSLCTLAEAVPALAASVRAALDGTERSRVLALRDRVFVVRYHPLRTRQGDPTGLLAVALDITAQVQGTPGHLQALPLSPDEQMLVQLLVAQKTNHQIGAHLQLSAKGVEKRLTKLYAHLGLARRSEVVAWALATGLRASDPPESAPPSPAEV